MDVCGGGCKERLVLLLQNFFYIVFVSPVVLLIILSVYNSGLIDY